MKIAICAKNNLALNSILDERFGRAEYCAIVDTDSKQVKVIENSAKNEPSGAAGKLVSLLNKQGVEALIVPALGPKAIDAINAFELTAYQMDESKTVEQVFNSYLAGKLTTLDAASVASHSGLRKV